MKIVIPEPVGRLMGRFEAAGFHAWAVGGAVRDSLRGADPGDWDLCTDAEPEQTKALFPDCRIIETGMKHGTVTVLWAGAPCEITTLREETGYSDHRRPDAVRFTKDLARDLARRDFTVNALAADAAGAVTDLYGGIGDLKAGILRCVGEPEKRFREDGLRLLRALRFCAVLGLRPDPKTEAALHRCRALLGDISAERIWTELKKLLCGPDAGRVLTDYADVLAEIIPEIGPCIGFAHKNPWHIYDVWGHIVKTVELAPRDPLIRFALLRHDLGKPEPGTEENGVRRFYGHTKASAALAERICPRLRLSKAERELVCHLVAHHDLQLQDTELFAKRMRNRWGTDLAKKMLAVYRADNGAKTPDCLARLALADGLEEKLAELDRHNAVTDLGQLAVSGTDLLALGLRGPAVGAALRQLLEQVLTGALPNEKDRLLEYINREKRP